LWLGIAVRDSCVVPVFGNNDNNNNKNNNKRKKKFKSRKADRDDNKKEEDEEETSKKVRGYTFAPVEPDPWLLPYTRVTVPSFYSYPNDNGPESSGGSSSSNNNGKNCNSDKAIFVWTPHGRQKLTPELYAAASLKGLRSKYTVSLCDYFVATKTATTLTDGDRNDHPKKQRQQQQQQPQEENMMRRSEKAERRNYQWFQYLTSQSKEKPTTTTTTTTTTTAATTIHPSLWAPILIPSEEEQVQQQSKSTTNKAISKTTQKENFHHQILDFSSDNLSGVTFIGQWRPGLLPNNLIWGSVNTTISDIAGLQWKAILSTQSLTEILDIAIEGYINVIGTKLPTHWAKDKLALGIDISMHDNESTCTTSSLGAKRRKITRDCGGTGNEQSLFNRDGCMDLSDKSFARDLRPLVEGCSCMACHQDRFSRAYIHHLVCAKELLAEILLFGHNLHHLLRLFWVLNESENASKVKDHIESQLPLYEIV
jgi:hypothetical protein